MTCDNHENLPPFLALPGEIRNTIISHLLHRPPGTIPPSTLQKSAMALPWTCRQLYHEFAQLTRSNTIYTFPWHNSDIFSSRTAEFLGLEKAAQIQKLGILLPESLGYMYMGRVLVNGRRRVRQLFLAAAGFANLREVYVRFREKHKGAVGEYDGSSDEDGNGGGSGIAARGNSAVSAGGPGRELVVNLLWRLIWERNLPYLSKICIVHDGAQPLLSLTLLLGMLVSFTPLGVSRKWEVKSDFQHGRLVFVEKGEGNRRIEVYVGYSFREAEEYVDVCREIMEGKHADVIIARRKDCKFVPPLHEMTDEELRQEVDNLYTLFPVSASEERVLQPHVQAIRNKCSLGV